MHARRGSAASGANEGAGAGARRPHDADASRAPERVEAAVRRRRSTRDGACKGNPGPGGWGALLRSGEHEKELFGGEAHTTNNRMELTAVIRALRVAQAPVATVDALHRLAVREERHRDLDPRLEAQRLEDRGQEARQERGPVARARRRSSRATTSRGTGCKGHADDAGNVRADALANRGVRGASRS